jgi:mono/diheme cytochrome c family protein
MIQRLMFGSEWGLVVRSWKRHGRLSSGVIAWAAALVVVCFGGCDARTDRFPVNELHAKVVAYRSQGASAEGVADVIAPVIEGLFGTPDVPKLPAAIPAGLLDVRNLERSAGAVSSDKAGVDFGLYRANCVVCHGLAGSGTGPAAGTQNPYPRDFRPGVFKYKSTPRESKPTKGDLARLLDAGVAGTGMPSFVRLPQEDRDALVDYVIYLAIRGETERRLVELAIEGSGSDAKGLGAASLGLGESGRVADEGVAAEIDVVVAAVAASWLAAEPIEVPAPTRSFLEDPVAAAGRGKELFHGPLANCASCHGPAGDGNVATLDFDDWTKEFTTKLGLGVESEAIEGFLDAGGLKPRPIRPRKLAWGHFRGGESDERLYRLLVSGIAGTPMPALLVAEEGSTVGVTQEQLWDLVAYLKTFAGEGLDSKEN